MKVTIGKAKLNPQTLFRIEASAPPADVKTVGEILAWQADENSKMLAEAGRLLHEQLVAAFAAVQRDQEGLPN